MIIKETNYSHSQYDKTGEYIHRYYLSRPMQSLLQTRDISALYGHVTSEFDNHKKASKGVKIEAGSIHYEIEGLIKPLPLDGVEAGFNACINYWRDCFDWNLSDEENQFLLLLNEKLKIFEAELHQDLFSFHTTLLREKHTESFAYDFEFSTAIKFLLRDDDPWRRNNDANILWECRSKHLTAHKENFDWNDMLAYSEPRHLPICMVPHCRLFHELESCSPIPLKHFYKIGMIRADIKIQSHRVVTQEDLTTGLEVSRCIC